MQNRSIWIAELFNQIKKKFFVTVILLFAIMGQTDGWNSSTFNNQCMINISIDFQDGFVNDSVKCQLNGKTIYSKNNCNTSRLIGLADSMSVKTGKGLTKLKVIILNRDIEKEISIDIKDDVYVGFSLVNDTIEYIVSAKPFGYG